MTTWALRGVGWIHDSLVSDRRADVLVDTLAPLLVGHARILDIGCGDARVARRLRQHLPRSRIVGGDILPSAGIENVRCDGSRLPFANGSFDAALLIDVLHHAEDPVVTVEEALRVSAGAVVIKDHVRLGRWSAWILAFMDWFGNRSHGVRLGYRYLTWSEWEGLFGRLRLRVDRVVMGVDLYPTPFNVLFRPEWHFVAKVERAGDNAHS